MYKSKHTSYEFGFYVKDDKYGVVTTATGDNPISTYLDSFRVPKGELALSHTDRAKLMVAEINPKFNKWFHTRNDIPCKAVRMINQIPAFKQAMYNLSNSRNSVPPSYVAIEHATDTELLQIYINGNYNKLTAVEIIEFLTIIQKL